VDSCKSIIFNSCFFMLTYAEDVSENSESLLSAQWRKQVAKVHYMTVYNDGTFFNDQ